MELIFVYNANGNVSDRMIGAIHKVIQPKSYACDLCKLTHSNLGARKEWKTFLETSSLPIRILYKDAFESEFSEKIEPPTILSYENSRLTCILDKKELGSLNDLEELFVVIKERLAKTRIE